MVSMYGYAASYLAGFILSMFFAPISAAGAYISKGTLAVNYLQNPTYFSYLDSAFAITAFLAMAQLVFYPAYFFFYYAANGYMVTLPLIFVYAIFPQILSLAG
jgi:hypothetical protein